MNLVKWIRKNERKIMTAVVIVIMIAFVGGSAFSALMKNIGKSGKSPVYLYYDNEKISSNDIMQAQKTLEILRELFANDMLTQLDYKSVMLSQILFPNTMSSVQLSDSLKRTVIQGQLDCSLKDIDNFFKQSSGRRELYWILLDAEAKKAGCVMSNEQAKGLLKQMLPQLSRGRGDAKMIIDSIISRQAAPEEQIFRAFADLMGITTYARLITGSDNVTVSQIRASVARNGRGLDSQFVKISATNFVKDLPQPTEEDLYRQFAKFKNQIAGQVSDDNPYGFGYSFPDRARLEYLFIKRSDVDNTVDEPTQQEMEEYYRLNSDRYTYSEKIDPADTQSETITRNRSYAEVSEVINATIKREKTRIKAEMIVNEAIEIIDSRMVTIDYDDATDEQFASAAGDYQEAARKINSKYKIPVYANTTGMLSAVDMANDQNLSRLSLQGQSQMPVSFSKVVFAVAGTTELGRFEVPTPRTFENIGPIRDSYGSIIGIVRVIKTENAFEPSDLGLSYDNTGVELKESVARKVYSIAEQAAEDIKIQKAMTTAAAKAEELSKDIAQKGWDDAVSEYNRKSKTGFVRIESISSKRKISARELGIVNMLAKEDPSLSTSIKKILVDNQQFDRLSSLVPAGETEVKNSMATVIFEPDKCCYLVKDVSVTAVTETDYLTVKNQAAYMAENTSSESLGIIHYLPDNILKRTAFRPVEEREKEEETEKKDSEAPGAV